MRQVSAASGTITILNGTIQWTNPATDANTHWELTVSVGNTTYCAWSGGGACRQATNRAGVTACPHATA